MAAEFWTTWGASSICGKHRTLMGAIKAAQKCEARGGSPHTIYRVTKVLQSAKRPAEGKKASPE